MSFEQRLEECARGGLVWMDGKKIGQYYTDKVVAAHGADKEAAVREARIEGADNLARTLDKWRHDVPAGGLEQALDEYLEAMPQLQGEDGKL